MKNIYCCQVALDMIVKMILQVGAKRVEAAAQKGNSYSLSLLFGKKNKAA